MKIFLRQRRRRRRRRRTKTISSQKSFVMFLEFLAGYNSSMLSIQGQPTKKKWNGKFVVVHNLSLKICTAHLIKQKEKVKIIRHQWYNFNTSQLLQFLFDVYEKSKPVHTGLGRFSYCKLGGTVQTRTAKVGLAQIYLNVHRLCMGHIF